MHIAMEFNALLPATERPEYTTGYEGFFHLIDITGTVEKTVVRYIVRDHDMQLFTNRKTILAEAANWITTRYGAGSIEINIEDQYFNMRKKIEPVLHIVTRAEKAMKDCGVVPIIKPIRGGTDGAKLSFMGLPTPNLFTGGHNFHGRFEYIPIQSMIKAVEVIVKLISI